MDSYLFYASATLVVMGLIAAALAVSLRFTFKKLRTISKDSVASVFNKSFFVFDPYEQKTVFHRLLTLLPFVPLIIGLGAGVLFLEIISSGLLLTLLVLIVALGLIVVEELPEVYAESKNLMKAIQDGSSLGVGDVKLLQATKKLLPRLSSYYVGLSALFFALAAILPIVWASFLWYFALSIGLLLQTSKTTGPAPISWFIGIAVYALVILGFILLVTKAKGRIFEYKMEPAAV